MFNSFRGFNQLINHRNYLYIIIKILCIYNSISDYYSVDDVIILYSKPDTPIHADRYFIRKMPTMVQYVDYRLDAQSITFMMIQVLLHVIHSYFSNLLHSTLSGWSNLYAYVIGTFTSKPFNSGP